MLKKIMLMIVSALLINLAIAPFAFASGNNEKEAKFAEKVKAGIAKLGIGPDAKVKVKLKDGTKIEGYVTEISADQFVVMDSKTDQPIPVPYPQVRQTKGHNLSSGTIITLSFIALFVVLIIIAANVKS